MSFKDLHEGILAEFAEHASTTMAHELANEAIHIEKREEHSRQCAARQRELRRDPILGDAYRAKLAAARREKFRTDPEFVERVRAARRASDARAAKRGAA